MAFDIIIGRNESDLKKFGKDGTVFIGRAFVRMGRTTSLSNNIYMDITKGHVVYIVGKRGSGKCLHGDTLVTLGDGSQVPIKDLEKNQRKILSLNKGLKLIQKEKTNFYKRKVNKLLEVALESGKKIKLTPEHPLLTCNGWSPAMYLDKGSRIASVNKSSPLNMIIQMQNMQQQLSTDASDIFWDAIVSIKELQGEFEVYDITVPETHNFVANDIIVHNSYSMGAIAEGVLDLPEDIKKNVSMIMFDTMGVYWTMKFPNEKDSDLLEQWNMQGKPLPVVIYTPEGFFKKLQDEGIPTDVPFSIKPSSLNSQDWILAFELETSDYVAVLIEKILGDLADERIEEYSIKDITTRIQKEKSFNDDVRNKAINLFRSAERWGLFSDQGLDLMDLVKPGQISVVDLSPYVATPGGWGVKALIVGLVGMRVFTQRMLARKSEEIESIKVGYRYFQAEEFFQKEQLPIVWLVIDEAHEFLKADHKTAATNALVTIMREGRQPGVCLIMATQQPGKIHSDVMSQADIVLAHRLTAKPDVDALAMMSQSYMTKSLPRMLDELPRLPGAALILDDNSERFYPMRVRPRVTWHGGEAPSAIKYRRKLDLKIS